MVVATRKWQPSGTSLKSLERGFILTCQTEGKSTRTVEYYRENLRRFLWYAEQRGWPDDARLITEWEIRDFLAYVSNATNRWGLTGNGSETSRAKASYSTVYHYFVVLSTFFNWAVREGFLHESPLSTVKVARPKPKLIQPYTREEIQAMLRVCDWDYQHNARFLGSRNRAIVLVLLDTGVRLSELVQMRLSQINTDRGWIKVRGKGGKERVVRMGKLTQKAVWTYLTWRNSDADELWLSEERAPISAHGVQCLIERLKERAGVRGDGSVHRFRHTFALNFLRGGGNPRELQYLLGHTSIDMSMRYLAALSAEDALRAHEKASPVDVMGIG